MAKVILKEVVLPEIAAGDQHLLTIGGKKLSESTLQKTLPILGISVLNESAAQIKVFINEEETNAFRVAANASRGLSGIPFTDVSIRNMSIDTIAAEEITVTLLNDFEQCREYEDSKRKGYTAL